MKREIDLKKVTGVLINVVLIILVAGAVYLQSQKEKEQDTRITALELIPTPTLIPTVTIAPTLEPTATPAGQLAPVKRVVTVVPTR